jgi:signal transduction histidine kinase
MTSGTAGPGRLPWWRRHDTLSARLFLLMWGTLVVSHLVAWFVVTRLVMQAPGAAPQDAAAGGPTARRGEPPLPPLGSLPPTPGVPQAQGAPPGPAGGSPRPPPQDSAWGAPPDPPPGGPPSGLPLSALLADYGIRIVVIGFAAWWAARWVSRPVRRMVEAAHELGVSAVRGRPAEALDESHGPAEARDAARVFNAMAERLATEFRDRGLLIASISHDLRTPLTRMRMRLESLLPAPGAARCISDLREMNELIDDSMYVFRGENAPDEPPQPTDVYALVQSLADDLVEQGHDVTLQGQSVVALVRPTALRRAVSNLIGNALRHGGSAEVTVLTLDGIRILIDDRGPGIPPQKIDEVFRPFMRLDPSRSRETGGAGLGLHIARSLLQQQGATLTLANRAEGGLRAEIRLPSEEGA